jgi:hypothetical protein
MRCHVIEKAEEMNICSAMTFAAIVAALEMTTAPPLKT